jgi:hypothetical protein
MWLKKFVKSWCVKLAAKYDFSNPVETERFLKDNLVLEGYDTAFKIVQNTIPIDEQKAKELCLKAIMTSPSFPQFQDKLAWMQSKLDEPYYYTPLVEFTGDNLVFEHDRVSFPLDLTAFGAKAVPPFKSTRGRNQHEKRLQENKKKLMQKLDDIQNTDDVTYLTHVNQCGYLAKNTKMRLWYLPESNMWGTSIMTFISGITLDDLRSFVDAAGKPTMANIDIRSDEFRREKERSGETIKQTRNGIEATHMGFASELMDFLNVELLVDPVGIASQVKSTGGDTQYQSIAEWGATPEVILKRLVERKPDLDPDDIKEYFMEGYNGTLV